jgi:hypothetical protein
MMGYMQELVERGAQPLPYYPPAAYGSDYAAKMSATDTEPNGRFVPSMDVSLTLTRSRLQAETAKASGEKKR